MRKVATVPDDDALSPEVFDEVFARAFYQQVIAEDSAEAEPALRMLAEEGRSRLPSIASVRRLLVVASS
jgi:hypothetical protein